MKVKQVWKLKYELEPDIAWNGGWKEGRIEMLEAKRDVRRLRMKSCEGRGGEEKRPRMV